MYFYLLVSSRFCDLSMICVLFFLTSPWPLWTVLERLTLHMSHKYFWCNKITGIVQRVLAAEIKKPPKIKHTPKISLLQSLVSLLNRDTVSSTIPAPHLTKSKYYTEILTHHQAVGFHLRVYLLRQSNLQCAHQIYQQFFLPFPLFLVCTKLVGQCWLCYSQCKFCISQLLYYKLNCVFVANISNR